ncbi:hypothetical protein OJAV_G00004540 [Oryzias javanicus]|uniref:Uncharacterized protein n=1 Tax=Oryzias javanicus TaxID=123683 RepID=A0A3S2MHG1_ORYJA|nr:hypothetical protein OJAV_G00004540 [Oryzias javanicus]
MKLESRPAPHSLLANQNVYFKIEARDWSDNATGKERAHVNTVRFRLYNSLCQTCKMPTSPVKTRIPITSFGHLITEVKKQLLGIEGPSAAELTGWRKHFNSYTLLGRRNYVLATYGILAITAAAYVMSRRSREDEQMPASTT